MGDRKGENRLEECKEIFSHFFRYSVVDKKKINWFGKFNPKFKKYEPVRKI